MWRSLHVGELAALLVLTLAGSAGAATIGYWRMEVDNDLTPAGLSVPNELAFGTALVSSEAQLDGVNLPNTIVPITFQSNDFIDSTWHHYAFTYDEVDGVASFYVDGVLVQGFDGPDGAPLILLAGTSIEAGVLMDYASAGQGTLDEIRIDGSALPAGALLLAPEPGSAALLGFGLVLLALHKRRS